MRNAETLKIVLQDKTRQDKTRQELELDASELGAFVFDYEGELDKITINGKPLYDFAVEREDLNLMMAYMARKLEKVDGINDKLANIYMVMLNAFRYPGKKEELQKVISETSTMKSLEEYIKGGGLQNPKFEGEEGQFRLIKENLNKVTILGILRDIISDQPEDKKAVALIYCFDMLMKGKSQYKISTEYNKKEKFNVDDLDDESSEDRSPEKGKPVIRDELLEAILDSDKSLEDIQELLADGDKLKLNINSYRDLEEGLQRIVSIDIHMHVSNFVLKMKEAGVPLDDITSFNVTYNRKDMSLLEYFIAVDHLDVVFTQENKGTQINDDSVDVWYARNIKFVTKEAVKTIAEVRGKDSIAGMIAIWNGRDDLTDDEKARGSKILNAEFRGVKINKSDKSNRINRINQSYKSEGVTERLKQNAPMLFVITYLACTAMSAIYEVKIPIISNINSIVIDVLAKIVELAAKAREKLK